MRRPAAILVAATVVAATLFATARPASALFHLMRIREVFAGVAGAEDAQYVELQMFQSFQVAVSGHEVVVYDAEGEEAGTFTFTRDVPNFQNQATILVATAAAEEFFGVTPDLEMTAVMDPAGGKVCFEDIDCVAWGTYSGSSSEPSPTGDPVSPSEGILAGGAVERKVAGGDNPDGLDVEDDSEDSEADFRFRPPTPTNNLGTTGEAPGGVLGFDRWRLTAPEGERARVAVHRAGGSESVSLSYLTGKGTARADRDYRPVSGALTFAEGDTEKSFRVRVLADERRESDERIQLRLRDPTGGAVLGRPNAILVIEDVAAA